MNDERLTTENTVYVTYIAASAGKVWEALTDSRFTAQYFFGHLVESDWKTGSRWVMRKGDGSITLGTRAGGGGGKRERAVFPLPLGGEKPTRRKSWSSPGMSRTFLR